MSCIELFPSAKKGSDVNDIQTNFNFFNAIMLLESKENKKKVESQKAPRQS